MASLADWNEGAVFKALLETIPTSTTLSQRLRKRIKCDGPITFCEWMRTALYDESDGYYRRLDLKRWGREGDYRTSPETSSLFAATFARYFAGLYDKLDQPDQWTIVEAGAGDGSFAYGVLKTLRECFPRVYTATQYVLDDIGTGERLASLERLQQFGDRIKTGRITETRVAPGLVFSNELLDAFAVHRVTLENGELREFYVGAGVEGNFTWELRAPSSQRIADYLDEGRINLLEGQMAEVNLAIEDWLTQVSSALASGYLITVDYGAHAPELYSSGMTGTLRGFRRHRMVDDVLADPGGQDLTSTVNWSFVEDAGEKLGLQTVDFQRQDKFLLAAGLLTQLQMESERAVNEAERLRLSTAAREMILPTGMASSFQVLVQERVAPG